MFLLLLMGLGAASVKAQVRIGGNGAPNAAAVLDLNVDDSATPAANKGALALPRVSLASTSAQLNGVTPITGMLVYNTNASMTGGNGIGMYFWDGTRWTKVAIIPNSTLKPVTWVLSLDTLIDVPAMTANTYFTVANTSAGVSDYCVDELFANIFISVNEGHTIAIRDFVGFAARTAHILCFRPLVGN